MLLTNLYPGISALLIAITMATSAAAQHKESFHTEHSIGINIGHEHSFNGVGEDGSRDIVILPYWGLDYNFQFASKFAVGLHVDFIIESFEVEKNLAGGDEQVAKRSYPIAPAVMIFYKPLERWSFGLGMGGEFAKEENYVLNRLAAEYGVPIRKGWEVFGTVQYDFRWQAYDTWTFGLGISKTFGGKTE